MTKFKYAYEKYQTINVMQNKKIKMQDEIKMYKENKTIKRK
jgi:hypothetical protein